MRAGLIVVVAFGIVLLKEDARAADSYKVDPSTTVTVSEQGYCRQVTNNHASSALFVPTRTAPEFLSFITHKPAFVNLVLCCPTGYVLIPGNGTYGTSNFCMMQFEAKNVGGVATSQASVSPWHTISHYEARRKCQALGTGYDLPSNGHWQTMARNVELVGVNWSSGTVGSGCMYIGNAGVAGVCSYNGTGTPNYETGTSGTNRTRARLQLSNGQQIWDASANVAEHVTGVFDANAGFVGGNVVSIDAPHKVTFGPSGTYSAASCAASSTDSTGGLCGLGWYGYGSPASATPYRGGAHVTGNNNSVFWAHGGNSGVSRSMGNDLIGFRCIYDANLSAPTCNGVLVDGHCWYLADSASSENCTSVCTHNGGYDNATASYAGSGGDNGKCQAVLDALQAPGSGTPSTQANARGCHVNGTTRRRGTTATTEGASAAVYRACACNN